MMLVVAGMAFASNVSNTKHNMASSSGSTVRSNNINEVCVFCHTPHGASTTMLQAPLWNRTNNATTWTNISAYYSSETMNGHSTAPDDASQISKACLTCHDGNIGDEALINGPGSGNAYVYATGNITFGGLANLNDAAGLANDHPIGINMMDIATGDNGSTQDIDIKTAPTTSSLRLFAGKVECATCHKVHDNDISPFLAMSNAGSAMCLACHTK